MELSKSQPVKRQIAVDSESDFEFDEVVIEDENTFLSEDGMSEVNHPVP
jgi:hypothetical protein